MVRMKMVKYKHGIRGDARSLKDVSEYLFTLRIIVCPSGGRRASKAPKKPDINIDELIKSGKGVDATKNMQGRS